MEPSQPIVLSSGRAKQTMMPTPPLPPPSTGRPREVPTDCIEEDAMSARTVSSRDHRTNPVVSRRALAAQSILHQPDTSWRFLRTTGDFATKDVLAAPASIKGRRDDTVQLTSTGSEPVVAASTTSHAAPVNVAGSSSDVGATQPVVFAGGTIADAEQVLASMLVSGGTTVVTAGVVPPRPLLFAGATPAMGSERKTAGASPSTMGAVHVERTSRMQTSPRLVAHSSLSAAPSEGSNVQFTGLRRDRARRPIDAATLAFAKQQVIAPSHRGGGGHADALASPPPPLAVRRERTYAGVGNSPKGRMLRGHAMASGSDGPCAVTGDPTDRVMAPLSSSSAVAKHPAKGTSVPPMLDALMDEMQSPAPNTRTKDESSASCNNSSAMAVDANTPWKRQQHGGSGASSLNGTRLLVHHPPLEEPLRDIAEHLYDSAGATPVSSLAKYRDQLTISRAEGHLSASQQVLALDPHRIREKTEVSAFSNDMPGVGFVPVSPCSKGAPRIGGGGSTLSRKVSRGALRQGQSKALDDSALRIHHKLYMLLEKETLRCTHDLLDQVPFLAEEALPVEEDLTSRMDIQRLYLTLHPLDRVEVATSVPPALQHAVAKTLKGVVVPLLLAAPGGGEAPAVDGQAARPYVATKELDSITHRMWHEAPGHIDITKLVGSKDYNDRCRLMNILRIKQREAEALLGVATTYTKIPPPLLPDEPQQSPGSNTMDRGQQVEGLVSSALGVQQGWQNKSKCLGPGAITSLSDIRLENLEEVADGSAGRVLELFHALERVVRRCVKATAAGAAGASDDDLPL